MQITWISRYMMLWTCFLLLFYNAKITRMSARMNVSFQLKKSKGDELGRVPIYVRITINGVSPTTVICWRKEELNLFAIRSPTTSEYGKHISEIVVVPTLLTLQEILLYMERNSF